MADHQSQNRTAVIALPAEIDNVNARQVGNELLAALHPGITTVIADMTATTFCDSSGVRALVQVIRQARANHAELVLVVASAGVLRVLALTGLDVLLPIYPTLPEAMAARATTDATRPG